MSLTRNRQHQKRNRGSVSRGVWGILEHVIGVGSIMSVRGTGTVDSELPVFNFGYSFNLPADSNAEVIMMSLGSDVNDKIAIPQLPRDAQRHWPEGTGGIQHPVNPSRYLEFNDDETHLRDGKFVIGSNREVVITVDGTNVTITTGGKATIEAGSMELNVAGAVEINSASLTHNGVNVGETHIHSGVDPGPGTTGGPQ